MAAAIRAGEPVQVIKHDGTQFIWAGHLARLYSSLLESDCNEQTFLGLGTHFQTWEEIARRAIAHTGSASQVIVEDRGWSAEPQLFDVSSMQRAFGLSFDDEYPRLDEHMEWCSRGCEE